MLTVSLKDLNSTVPRLHEMISFATDDTINRAYVNDSWFIAQMRRMRFHLMIDQLQKYESSRFDQNPNGTIPILKNFFRSSGNQTKKNFENKRKFCFKRDFEMCSRI